MKLPIIRLGILLCLASAPCFGQSWSGYLVDSKCYDAEERNVNPQDTMTAVDRDRELEIRYCTPNLKTKSFAVVQHNGLSFKLDSSGNVKAAELVRKTSRKSYFEVTVTGEIGKNNVHVISILPTKNEMTDGQVQ